MSEVVVASGLMILGPGGQSQQGCQGIGGFGLAGSFIEPRQDPTQK
jgi:hypothetical protein